MTALSGSKLSLWPTAIFNMVFSAGGIMPDSTAFASVVSTYVLNQGVPVHPSYCHWARRHVLSRRGP